MNQSMTILYDENSQLPEVIQWIMLKPPVSFYQGFTIVQSIFEKYTSWENEVLQAIASKSSIHNIISRCAKMLKNPIALFDTSYVMIEKAGDFSSDNTDTIWDEVIHQGYFSIQNHSASEGKLLLDSKVPFVIQLDSITKAQTCIRQNGQIVAYLGATDLKGPFTAGQLAIIYAVQRFFETTDALASVSFDENKKSDIVFQRLLQGYNIEESVVHYVLDHFNWKVNDTFQLIYFYDLENSFTENQAPLIFSIKKKLSNAKVYLFEEGILAICHQSANDRQDYDSILLPLITKQRMAAVISEKFNDFFHLRYAYLQCRMTMTFSQPQKISGIWHFSDIFENYIMQSLTDTASLQALCHPYILSLSKNARGKDYIRTLQTYIMYGRNISDTANQLYVHRNTLIYRIEKLEKDLHLDFKTASEKELFFLYLSCLIVKYI